MEVRDDDARDRPPRERPAQRGVPERARLLEPHPGVDDRPAVAVLEHPEIDVVELERQRHAQPGDARGDIEQATGARRGRPRV